jgi:hypothetical protein
MGSSPSPPRRPLHVRAESLTNEQPPHRRQSPSRPNSTFAIFDANSNSTTSKNNNNIVDNPSSSPNHKAPRFSPQSSPKRNVAYPLAQHAVATGRVAKRPLPSPPVRPIPVLTPGGWKQGPSLNDTVSNYAPPKFNINQHRPTPSIGVPSAADLRSGSSPSPFRSRAVRIGVSPRSRGGSIGASAATAVADPATSTKPLPQRRRSPRTPTRANSKPYRSNIEPLPDQENNVRTSISIPRSESNSRWDESTHVAGTPLQRPQNEQQLFETPSSGTASQRNSLDELLRDIARYHSIYDVSTEEPLAESPTPFENQQPSAEPGQFGSITTESPVSTSVSDDASATSQGQAPPKSADEFESSQPSPSSRRSFRKLISPSPSNSFLGGGTSSKSLTSSPVRHPSFADAQSGTDAAKALAPPRERRNTQARKSDLVVGVPTSILKNSSKSTSAAAAAVSLPASAVNAPLSSHPPTPSSSIIVNKLRPQQSQQQEYRYSKQDEHHQLLHASPTLPQRVLSHRIEEVELQYPTVRAPSTSSSYAESTIFIPKRRAEKSSYHIEPLKPRKSDQSAFSPTPATRPLPDPSNNGHDALDTNMRRSDGRSVAPRREEPSSPDEPSTPVARVPRSAFSAGGSGDPASSSGSNSTAVSLTAPANRSSTISEGGDGVAELLQVQRARRSGLRHALSFESQVSVPGSAANESSAPASSRGASSHANSSDGGAATMSSEELPNWTRYDAHVRALGSSSVLSLNSSFYNSVSTSAGSVVRTPMNYDVTSQASTILSPEAARYAIFRERHIEQMSERAPGGSPDMALQSAPTFPVLHFRDPPRVSDSHTGVAAVAAVSEPARAHRSEQEQHRSNQTGSPSASRLSDSRQRQQQPQRVSKRKKRRRTRRKLHEFHDWSPHLVIDRRSAVVTPWQPPQPELSGEHEDRFSPVNMQITFFCLGFIFPPLWMVAALLPLPPKPSYASAKRRAKQRVSMAEVEKGPSPNPQRRRRAFGNPVEGQNGVLATADEERAEVASIDGSRRSNDLYYKEIRHGKARWWRNINRLMSVIGLLVIGAIIALVVVAVK